MTIRIGDTVRVTTATGTVAITRVMMASLDGRKLALEFDDAKVSWWGDGWLPVRQEDDGTWRAIDQTPLQIERVDLTDIMPFFTER
jgi:hypothetical protein